MASFIKRPALGPGAPLLTRWAEKLWCWVCWFTKNWPRPRRPFGDVYFFVKIDFLGFRKANRSLKDEKGQPVIVGLPFFAGQDGIFTGGSIGTTVLGDIFPPFTKPSFLGIFLLNHSHVISFLFKEPGR